MEITSAFPKGGLTGILRDSIFDFMCDVGGWFDQGLECGVGVESA